MKTTKRLTAVALVLLLLLSLCGCMTEEPTPSGQGGTTAVPTQVTTTDSSAPTTTATDAQPTTAETTVETTVETTKVPTTAATITTATTTAAPTTTVPPILWQMFPFEETGNDFVLPGDPIEYSFSRTYDLTYADLTLDERKSQAVCISDYEMLGTLKWNNFEKYHQTTFYTPPSYPADFFEKKVVAAITVESVYEIQALRVDGVTVDGETLYVHITELSIDPAFSGTESNRVLLELAQSDVTAIKNIKLYGCCEILTREELNAWWEEMFG